MESSVSLPPTRESFIGYCRRFPRPSITSITCPALISLPADDPGPCKVAAGGLLVSASQVSAVADELVCPPEPCLCFPGFMN